MPSGIPNNFIEHPERFWDRFSESNPEKCWVWPMACINWGYGHVRHEGELITTHRLAWILTNGPIPDDMLVLHECDNPPCCNPNHLFLGTHKDNMEDMAEKGRSHIMPGEENPATNLTAKDVLEIRRDYKPKTQMTCQFLAGRHGVTKSTISKIIRRVTWAHI